MQELSDSIKRSNLGIMVIEEEEMQAKGIHNIVNKIIAENLNLKKKVPIQLEEASRTTKQIKLLHGILSLKQLAQRIRKEY
jgi:hypothetical protein